MVPLLNNVQNQFIDYASWIYDQIKDFVHVIMANALKSQ